MEDEMMETKTLYMTVNEIQKDYLPIGKKKLRRMMVDNLRVVRNGNRILVNREESSVNNVDLFTDENVEVSVIIKWDDYEGKK